MEVKRRNALRSGLSIIVVFVGAAACDEGSVALAPEMEAQTVLAAMEAAIQDEFKAELTYEKVLDEFGPARPFVNIVKAEVRHSEALGRLYAARGLPVPNSLWSPAEIPEFSSLAEACRAGVVAEIENAEIYEGFLDHQLPDDVRVVFENNRRASLENHLPAFQRCS
jgi:hypothetical protein